MILLPAAVAVVLFALLPGGRVVAGLTGLEPSAASVLGAAVVATVVAFALRALVDRDGPDPDPDDDDLRAIGTTRGQRALVLVLPLLAGAAGAAFLWAGAGPARALVVAAALAAAALDAPLRRERPRPGLPPPPVPPERLPSVAGPGPAVAPEDALPPPDDRIEREVGWRFRPSLEAVGGAETEHSMSLVLSRSRYEAARARPRFPRPAASGWGSTSRYVLEGLVPEVRRCARELSRGATDLGLPYLDTVAFVLAFLREAFPYATDEATHGVPEYPSFPIETLVEGRGDCEDHAILCAALLLAMGFDVVLFHLDLDGPADHLAVGVAADAQPALDARRWLEHDGRRYYYAEATPEGAWRLGEIPPEFAASLRNLYALPVTDPSRG